MRIQTLLLSLYWSMPMVQETEPSKFDKAHPMGMPFMVKPFSLNDGPQRIELDATIPGPGTYFIGGNGMELYRNNSGTDYPYITEGIVTITRSTATTDPMLTIITSMIGKLH